MKSIFWAKSGVSVAVAALALGCLSPVVAVEPTQEVSPTAASASATSPNQGQIPYGEAAMGAGAYDIEADAPTTDTGRMAAAAPPAPGVLGMDVSSHQPSVNWVANYQAGARFALVKATESTWYTNPRQRDQYAGAGVAGMFRGVYHFAIPSDSSGAEQARFFVANSQKWVQDGTTLPGVLDFEWNPYPNDGNTCYNMTPAQLKAWAQEFAVTYRQLTGRYPILYTATSWVNQCLGSLEELSFMPLHLARYTQTVGPMPTGYSAYDIWQYSATGPFDGDSNVFNGSTAELTHLAVNPRYRPLGATSAGTTSGLYSLRGAIGGYYRANYKTLYAPRADEYPVSSGGVTQPFENSRQVYWHPSTGTHAVYLAGAIGARYANTGYERTWGFPSMDEAPLGYGVQQRFVTASGSTTAVYWSPQTSARVLNGSGGIHNRWNQNLAEYGLPATDESALGRGAVVRFEKNVSLYWSPSTPTAKVNTGGALRAAWVKAGYHQALGFPLHDERWEADGDVHLRLSSGAHFVWSEQQGVRRLS
ncbi:GH25 family lysozyme [Rothia nasisuis]|uniref:GH25 family lysozyme n=1 Tax=Rothia nasisuis TaxID=2109647 RepID=UPI001F389BD7|nr:GH25 family lysozyme [Rothia nasisuis]